MEAAKKKLKYYQNNGYTILELSISIAIVALIITGGLSVVSKKSDAERTRVTKERMNKIEVALAAYVDANKYLPCPSQGNSLEDNSVGTFGDSTGVYDAASHTCLNNLTNYVGMVPVRTLGLADYYAYDGWDRKFSYRIATGMGGSSNTTYVTDFDSYRNAGIYSSVNYQGDIVIVDINGVEKTSTSLMPPYNVGAAYVLISYGADGYGAWYKNNSTTPSTAPSTSLEAENTDHLTSSPDNVYIQADKSYIFDDIVTYKTKNDLIGATTGASPFKIPNSSCTNANLIVSGGVPSLTNTISSLSSTATTNNLGTQIYQAALYTQIMCNNPPASITETSSSNWCRFKPTSLKSSNLIAWYDGMDVYGNNWGPYSDGTVFNPWCNKAQNNYHGTPCNTSGGCSGVGPTQSRSDPFPGGTKGSVWYSGSTYNEITGNYFANTNFTVFIAASPSGNNMNVAGGLMSTQATTQYQGLIFAHSYGASFPQPAIMMSFYSYDIFTPIYWRYLNSGSFQNYPTYHYSFSSPIIYTFMADSTNGHRIRGMFNDGRVSEKWYPSLKTLLGSSATKTHIGISQNMSNYFTGWIGEIIVYNTVLTPAERRIVEGYLARKWMTGECQ